jgi:hypothetical protein
MGVSVSRIDSIDIAKSRLAGFIPNYHAYNQIESSSILSVLDMHGVARGKSSLINERRAAKKLELAATTNSIRDPLELTSNSAELVLTILYNHVNMGSADGIRILSMESVSA